MARVKLLTSNVYSPTNPSSEAAIREQIDGSIQEVYDTFAAETGSANVGHDSPNIAATNTKDAIEEVYAAIASTVLGEIPDNSITNVKLATDIKVGSLATLTTTEKSSVVGAINELDAYVDFVPEQVDTIETNLNILRTAKVTTGSNVALAVDTDGTFDMTRNGNILTIIPNVTNTGAMTVTVDGQATLSVKKANDAGTLVDTEAGDSKQNVPMSLVLQTSGTPVFICAPKWGGNIKSIQKGTTSSTAAQFTQAVSSIDTTKSILMISFFNTLNDNTPSKEIVRGKINSSTQIEFNRFATGSSIIVEWQLVEFKNVKSKQSGTTVLTSATTDQNLAISSVNTSKCLFYLTYSSARTTAYVSSVKGSLQSATNLTFRHYYGATLPTVDWQLLEFN